MMAKRQIKELDDLNSLEEPTSKVQVHGVITAVSPLKQGRKSNYFDGTLSDESDKRRIVGFSSSQQKLLAKFMEERQPVQIVDCEAKQPWRGDKLELLLKGTTKIMESPKKIDVPRQEVDSSRAITITLSQLQETDVYERVDITVKVISVADPVAAGLKTRQDITIADSTGTGLLQLWENDVGTMNRDASYLLSGFLVREYASSRYLSKARNESNVQEVEDLEDVHYEAVDMDQPSDTTILYGAQIVAVSKLDSIRLCMRCKGRVEPSTPPLGRCSVLTCSMMQRYDLCRIQKTAHLLVLSRSHEKFTPLSASAELLTKLVGDDITEKLLLSLPVFATLTYNTDQKTILSFSY